MSVAWRRNLATLALFSCVSVAFSWPLVLAPATSLVSRQVDAFGMVWLASQAPTLALPFRSELVAWPFGQDLGWCDSYLFLLVVRALGLARSPVLALSLFTLVGPPLSAWAAERACARLLGVRWPWSLLAGLGYGFSGVMVTGLLEGHLYALLNPWLPLLCWAWALTLGPGGRAWHGLLAGLAWVACLLTTAYAGLAGTLLVLGLAAFLARPGRTRWAPLAAAAAVALPVGLAYVLAMAWVVPVAETAALPRGIAQVPLRAAAASLASLAGWYPGIDTFQHSMGPALGWTVALLAATAPLVLRRERLWIGLLVSSLGALGLALGPQIGPLFHRDLYWTWTPWSLLDPASLAGFRFPCRLMLLTSFGLAAVGALAADALAREWPRAAWLLFPAMAVDLFVVARVGDRTGVVPLTPPAAYAALPPVGAVIELLPPSIAGFTDFEMFVRSLTEGYQTQHGHPLVHAWGSDGQGVISGYTRAPGFELDRAFDALFFHETCPTGAAASGAGPGCDLHPWLAALGIGAVIVRPTLWMPAERARVLGALVQGLGPPVANTFDVGEWVLVFEVQGALADQGAAATAWRRWNGQ
ncbi:MAG: hypothetical protein ABIO70_13760 [Pseudomonadota bacterium]